MTRQIQKMQESKTTTVLGGLTVIGGMLVTLIPSGIRSTCFDAIQSSENPLMVGGLVVGGLLLTVIGPSLSKK